MIGFVHALNGEINNPEVYNNRELLRKLWPKLLKATVIEAVAEWQQDKPRKNERAEDPTGFFEKAASGSMEQTKLSDSTTLKTYTTPTTLLYETIDTREGANWLHRNYIHKVDD